MPSPSSPSDVPPAAAGAAGLDRLRALMRRLRAPVTGCPWDRAQTFASLVPHTLEEAYEVADAIESDRLDDLPAELGDLLFQVIFYSQIGEEQGHFDLDRVMAELADKLIQRHPHVFGAATADDAATVARQWEAHKAAERRARRAGEAASELDDVPLGMPALTRAAKLQKRAARIGFDWPDRAGARAKLDEELAELDVAASAGDAGAIAGELGDVLFSAVNLARHLGQDPEAALRAANQKFERRFRYLEATLAVRGVDLAEVDDETMDALWEEAKARGL